MLSTAQIVAESARAARVAARKHLTPYVPWDASEIDGFNRFPFPFLGDYRPKGWELQEYVTADATGLGYESEPALTVRGLRAWCKAQIAAHPGRSVGFAITEAGEFQVVVASFVRIK